MSLVWRFVSKYLDDPVFYSIRGHKIGVYRPNELGHLVLSIVAHLWSWSLLLERFDSFNIGFVALTLFWFVLSVIAFFARSIPKWKDGWLLVPEWMVDEK